MKSALRIGEKITLNEIGTEKQTVFTINEVIGVGASCIVYTAVYSDGEGNEYFVRLKEFYPNCIDIERNGTSLDISDTERFSDMLSFFTTGYQKQLEFRNNPEQMNSISNVQGVYTGNNTKYIAMSCNNGSCISEDDEFSLTDIFRIVCAVAKQIKAFHQNGYLYLDLKPNNIFLYPETPDMVMLFDFDSVISKENVLKHSEWLSYTAEWSAPELSRNQISKIDERADIYSIGALLLFLLFKRKPELSDRRRFASWDNEIKNSFLSAESPENIRIVTDILKKTLSSSANSRFESCDEIIEITEKYIEKILAPKPFLKTYIPMGNNFFCGRDREIAEIHRNLKEISLLVLHGIGGIGKSELAKHYALKHSGEYDAAVFVRFDKDIKHTVISDTNFPIVNVQRSENESDDEYFNRKINVLKTICTERHLIIIDNFDTEECENLDCLTGLHCKILVTSRVDYSDIFRQTETGVMQDFEDIRRIFEHYCEVTADEYIDRIIYALEGHTMGVELVSRQMKKTGITSEEMYERLAEHGVSATEDKIRNFKDGNILSKSALKHLEILFSVFGLSDEILNILAYVGMAGTTLIPEEELFELCEFDDDEISDFSDAVTRGWIQVMDGKVQLHPLICEVILSQLNPDIEDTWRLVKSLEEGYDNIDSLRADERLRRENIMRHMAKHIHGEPAILVQFLRKMEKVYVDWKEYAEAEKCLLKIMELSVEIWGGSTDDFKFEHFNLAEYAEYQGEYERAAEYSRKAKEIITDRQALIAEYYDADDYDTEIDCANKLLKTAESDEDFYEAYNFLAQTEKDYNEDSERVYEYAEKELCYAMKELESENGEMFDLLKNIAEAYEHLDDYEMRLFT